MHYYLFHIKDYRAKTAHLTPLEHYIYRTLIDWYYLSEKPFESVEQIARYLLLPLNDENVMAINNVLNEFFNFCKSKYHHKRINAEIKNYHYKNGNGKVTDDNADNNEKVTSGNAKSNGNALSISERQARYKERKKMLKALADMGVTLDDNASFNDVRNAYNDHFSNADNADNNEKVTQNNGENEARTINQEPLTINQSPSPQTPKGAGVSSVNQTDNNDETTKTQSKTHSTTPKANKTLNVPFETFWDAYDKKINPKKCELMWEKLSDKDRLAIMAYIPKYKQAQPDKAYRKHPQTFLNNRGWEDEIIDRQPQPPQSNFGNQAPMQDDVDKFFGGSYWAFLEARNEKEKSLFPKKMSEAELKASRAAAAQVLGQFKVSKA